MLTVILKKSADSKKASEIIQYAKSYDHTDLTKLFDTLVKLLEEYFEKKNDFEKKVTIRHTTKKKILKNYQACKKSKIILT